MIYCGIVTVNCTLHFDTDSRVSHEDSLEIKHFQCFWQQLEFFFYLIETDSERSENSIVKILSKTVKLCSLFSILSMYNITYLNEYLRNPIQKMWVECQ